MHTHTKKNSKTLVYTNMGWLGDGSHRGQVRHAWTAVVRWYYHRGALSTPQPMTASGHVDSLLFWGTALWSHRLTATDRQRYQLSHNRLQQCTTVRVTVVRIMSTLRYATYLVVRWTAVVNRRFAVIHYIRLVVRLYLFILIRRVNHRISVCHVSSGVRISTLLVSVQQ